MTKDKLVALLTTLVVVIVGVVIVNTLTTFREVDSTGKSVPDGKAYKAKLGLRKK